MAFPRAALRLHWAIFDGSLREQKRRTMREEERTMREEERTMREEERTMREEEEDDARVLSIALVGSLSMDTQDDSLCF
jgi:hypothetical protein